MKSSRVVRVVDCQCQSRNSPGFDPSILRHKNSPLQVVETADLASAFEKKIADFLFQ
jgi:hypothetical protein